MAQEPPTLYGRTDPEWDALTAEGLRFLIERAQMKRTTSYTELNTVLGQRTRIRMFDFDHESERAAMGQLLYSIVERERPSSGHMISSIVIYLNENDAGTGFYKLAQSYGVLPKNPSADEKLKFWANEVHAIHDYYDAQKDSK
jgi:hypothetical protein